MRTHQRSIDEFNAIHYRIQECDGQSFTLRYIHEWASFECVSFPHFDESFHRIVHLVWILFQNYSVHFPAFVGIHFTVPLPSAIVWLYFWRREGTHTHTTRIPEKMCLYSISVCVLWLFIFIGSLDISKHILHTYEPNTLH